jgi:hypothetical protein
MKGLRLHIVWLLMALTVLPAVTSCYNYDEEDVSYSDASANYINVTISVSASDNAFTRAPQGGEYGDGTEKGFEREYEVRNITLIFYQNGTDGNGINTTSDDAVVKCVKSYVVRPMTGSDLPTAHNHKTGEPETAQGQEVLYTTGNQKLDDPLLQLGETYRLLVVANASVDVSVGNKIKDVRDKVAGSVYTGSGAGIDATYFVMTSETDASVTLADPSVESTSSQTNFIYYFPCIHLERLAARIDYCTKGATYSDTYNGFKYNVGSTDNDGFYVITKVTPFNLYNDQEFLFKRVRNNWTDATPVITYLGDESTTNYVVDPKTANKDNSNTGQPVYLSPIAEDMSNSYTQTMGSLSTDQTFTDPGGNNNVIIAYPKENTLMPSSYLKKYATGIAFEANYYANPDATPIRRVYYHYLRHQGELSTGNYQAHQWSDLSADESMSSHNPLIPMNYGVVRNNIYRISIEGFSTVEGTIKIKIEEKHWRHVDNPTIYI